MVKCSRETLHRLHSIRDFSFLLYLPFELKIMEYIVVILVQKRKFLGKFSLQQRRRLNAWGWTVYDIKSNCQLKNYLIIQHSIFWYRISDETFFVVCINLIQNENRIFYIAWDDKHSKRYRIQNWNHILHYSFFFVSGSIVFLFWCLKFPIFFVAFDFRWSYLYNRHNKTIGHANQFIAQE